MKIKQIEEIDTEGIVGVVVSWEDGTEERFQGQPAKTLLQMTEMKVGERYIITSLTSGDKFYCTVLEITNECVNFSHDISVWYKDCNLTTFERINSNTAKERVEQELAELEERYEKLDNFVGNARYMELPYAQKYLLVKQLAVMEEYTHILKARLDCWKD